MTKAVPPKLKIRSPFWASICCLYALVLLCGTHWPGDGWAPTIGVYDKFLHFSAYATLAFLFCLGLKAHPSRSQVCFFSIAYTAILLLGCVDEITQWPIPGRYPDALDWLADGIGTLVGMIAFGITSQFFAAETTSNVPAELTTGNKAIK